MGDIEHEVQVRGRHDRSDVQVLGPLAARDLEGLRGLRLDRGAVLRLAVADRWVVYGDGHMVTAFARPGDDKDVPTGEAPERHSLVRRRRTPGPFQVRAGVGEVVQEVIRGSGACDVREDGTQDEHGAASDDEGDDGGRREEARTRSAKSMRQSSDHVGLLRHVRDRIHHQADGVVGQPRRAGLEPHLRAALEGGFVHASRSFGVPGAGSCASASRRA